MYMDTDMSDAPTDHHISHADSIGGAVCAPKKRKPSLTWLDHYRKRDEPIVREVTAITRNMLSCVRGGGSASFFLCRWRLADRSERSNISSSTVRDYM
jgi:hypothetical protein